MRLLNSKCSNKKERQQKELQDFIKVLSSYKGLINGNNPIEYDKTFTLKIKQYITNQIRKFPKQR